MTWAIRLARAHARAAVSLRLYEPIEVCQTPEACWLRGPDGGEELDQALLKLPADGRYTVSGEGRLTPLGARVPVGRLPDGPWRPLSVWVTPEVRPAAMPGEIDRRVRVRLVRTNAVREPSVLVTDAAALLAYGTTAPLIRLERLMVAVASDGRVVVRGRPLPPIPGRRFVEDGGIAVPCGFQAWPPVGAGVLRRLLNVSEDGLALLEAAGSSERIPPDVFVAATRASLRLSVTERRDG